MYIVMAAIFILLSGLIIEKYGIKRVALFSAILFGVSSVMCGLSTSLTEMVIFRAFQGIGGAFLPAAAQTYIAQNFKGKDFNKMMTIYTLVIVMGPILGPVLGGAICEHMSWPWIFYVNVPLCTMAFVVVFFYMESDRIKKIKIDYISFGFMAMGIGCLEFFFDNGSKNDWFNSLEMIIILAISIISLGFFLWRGLLGSSVVKLKIFKNLNFVVACFLCFTFILLFTAALAYFPTMLQQIYGYPVDLAGYITAPRGVAAIIGAGLAQGVLIKKIGARKTVSLGIFLFAISCFMMASYSPIASKSLIIMTTVVQGLGITMFFLPIMQAVVVGFDDEDLGDMSGVFNFFRSFGSSVATAFIATIITKNQQVHFQELSSNISSLNQNFQSWTHNLPASEITTVAVAKLQIIHQAGLLSYINSFYIVGLLSLFLIIVPFFLKEPSKDAPTVMAH